MERLKRGDVCPLCGGELTTEDPFVLGYLTAVRDLLETGRFEEPAPADCIDAEGTVVVSEDREEGDKWSL